MSSAPINHASSNKSVDHTHKPSPLSALTVQNPNAKSPIVKKPLITRYWQTVASYSLMLGGVIVLSACQSNSALSKPTNRSALIDFTVANPAAMQAQSEAFNKSLKASDKRYQQLFDQNSFPNSDSQAKRHVLSAIRQHLAAEHVAVAKANYNAVPFIDADSVDAGSTGLLRTILEVYAYRENKENSDTASDYDYDDDYDDYDDNDYSDRQQQADTLWIEDEDNPGVQYAEYAERTQRDEEVDAAEEVVVVEEEDSAFEVAYSKDGYDYDSEGYDSDGYDEQGFDRSGYDYDGFDKEGYDSAGYDYYGYDREGEYLEDYDEGYEEGYESDVSDNSIRELIADNNPKQLLADYEAMQAAKQSKKNSTEQSANPFARQTPGAISLILGMLHKTPEQVAAANAYQYQYLTFNSVSHYLPKQRQFNSVYSYDYAAPTISSSVQLPIAFDFSNSKVTVDPAAIMPIVALANPENTPVQMTAHTVDFGLPEAITAQIPSAVIYDAAINAMQASLAELAPEHFSAVDIREDSFAKEVGASRAVKVYFGSKQTGEIIGKMLKYMSQSLQQYVDANPSQYPDEALLKKAIAKVELYNKGYQSADVGALLQLIEAVVPISFNQVNYYYLDSSDKLLAKQQRITIGGDLMGSNTTVVNEIRYDRRSFASSALTPLLEQSFGVNAKPAIDGNAWLSEQRKQTERLEQARYARYDYAYGGYNNDAYTEDEAFEFDKK